MITIVIPTLNAGATLNATFAALMPAVIDGPVTRVIVVDGGSSDETIMIADEAGSTVIQAEKGRGQQLAAGGAEARTSWILFLHADTRLMPGWEVEAKKFMAAAEHPGVSKQAAAFKFAVDEPGLKARMMEKAVALRCAVFALPYGDQGLLISTEFYQKIGGFKALPLMEDVDIIRRIGAKHLTLLNTPALTSFSRYRAQGFFRRIFRNLTCLTLYFLGVSPARIARRYE